MNHAGIVISNKGRWAPLAPYVTVGIGLLVLHNAWIAILGYHLCMVLVLLFVDRKVFNLPVLALHDYKIIAVTAILGGLGGLLLYLFWPLLDIPRNINVNLQQLGLTALSWPYFIAYFVLVGPWLEEYYWRGYLGSGSKWIILSDLWFSGYHVIVLAGKMNFVWLIIVFMALVSGAWFWRQANRCNQGLAPSIISHAIADISIILVIYFMTVNNGS